MSILHKFPIEVLSRIFELCLPANLHSSIPDELPSFPDQTTLSLCEVDRYTRAVATSTPQLWSFIRITVPEYSPKNAYSHSIPIWLHRSGSLPLHLELYQKTTYSESPKDASLQVTRNIFNIFKPYLHRCRALHLEVDSRTIDLSVATFPDALVSYQLSPTQPKNFPLSHLEKLHLKFLKMDSSEPTLPFNISAPLLTEVSGSIILDSEHQRMNLPWSQITVLNLNMHDLASSLELFNLCPNLTTYKLEIDTASSPTSQNLVLDPVVHDNLTTFHVHGSSHDLQTLFRKLTLPKLLNLQVKNSPWVYASDQVPWPHQDFLNMLSRSQCRVTCLHLLEANMDPKELQELSLHPAMSYVKDLETEKTTRDEWCSARLLECLTIPSSSTGEDDVIPFRSLEVLGIRGDVLQPTPDSPLATMLHSRCRTTNSEGPQKFSYLRHLRATLLHISDWTEDTRQLLFQNHGLHVTLD